MNRPTALLILTLATSACTNSPAGPTDLVGPAWQLVSLQEGGSPPLSVADPSRYTISFGDDGRVALKSDCNSCGGSYSMTGAALQVAALACTKVACPSGSLDARYRAAIEHTQSASRDGDDLVLQSEGVTLRYRK